MKLNHQLPTKFCSDLENRYYLSFALRRAIKKETNIRNRSLKRVLNLSNDHVTNYPLLY